MDKLKSALDILVGYLETNPDLKMLSPTTSASNSQDSLFEVLANVMSIRNGGLTSQQLAELLINYGNQNEVNKKLKLFYNGNKLQANNEIRPIIGEDSKGPLSIIQVDTIRVIPAGRDNQAVSALLSMIPTLELSRCIPYLTIDVQVGRPPINSNNVLDGMSLIKFLNGAADVSNSNTEKSLALSLQGKVSQLNDFNEQSQAANVTVSGMELFTSPQTLVNPDRTIDSRRAGPVIDKFRPFMSIEKFNVELTPQVGFFAYRTADLDITLHDRSRLSEIADFVKPDLYGTTELLIEYGWSHPDGSDRNVFGKLLNAMRVKEKYGIINSTFSMTKTGEVKIKLRLFTKGMSDLMVTNIGDGNPDAMSAIKAVRSLQKSIASIKSRLSFSNDKGNKELRGEQELFANSDDIGSTLILSKESRSSLIKFLTAASKSSNQDIKDLSNELKTLYGQNGRDSQVITKLKKSVAATINTKLKNMNKADKAKGDDPFLFSAQTKLNDILKRLNEKSVDYRTGYVSLARLMTNFVGLPLANKQQYADVQLIFYPFNAKAGACANNNIAEFIIDTKQLDRGLQAIAQSRGTNIPIKDFIQYIANNFIDDITNSMYGLSNTYKPAGIDPKTGQLRKPSGWNKDWSETEMYDRVQSRLLKIGSQDGTFKPPQLDVIIETVPGTPTIAGQSANAMDVSTILKIHFFDRCATAYEGLGNLILASREEDLRTIGEMANNISNDHAATHSELINKAIKTGVLTSNNDKALSQETKAKLEKVNATATKEPNNVYNVTFDIEKLRSFIRQNIPTLVYGTNNTGIKDAVFSTIQNPLLSTVHMIRSGDNGPLSPSGLTKANLPLRTLPAKVNMTTIGCPLINYMQQFFIDFNTNTTIDNIYGVNKLTHEISPGKFETKIDFVPLDAYGRYESLPNQVGAMLQKLEEIISK